jgi:hypothetical protein
VELEIGGLVVVWIEVGMVISKKKKDGMKGPDRGVNLKKDGRRHHVVRRIPFGPDAVDAGLKGRCAVQERTRRGLPRSLGPTSSAGAGIGFQQEPDGGDPLRPETAIIRTEIRDGAQMVPSKLNILEYRRFQGPQGLAKLTEFSETKGLPLQHATPQHAE